MKYESDYGHSIYYIDGEELNNFINSEIDEIIGYAYEWENEKVTHIHFSPIPHAFGKIRKIIISKKPKKDVETTENVVYVAKDGTASIDGNTILCIPSFDNLYSRSKGLIELEILASKSVLIIGLGSGGSSIAVQLAKTGIGHFYIVDFDRVELHNLSRHICNINDLGRLKTDAIFDAIKGKNPYAVVDKLPIDVNKNLYILEDIISKVDIVLCCTDNNASRFNISELLVKHKKVGIFGRCMTRAEGGDVFIYRPGGACYTCLIGNKWYDTTAEEITDLASAKRAGRIPAYVSEEDGQAVVQVGLGTDIEPINNMISKLALVELSRGTDSGISSLEKEFSFNYYIWANRREKHYLTWGCFNNTDCMPTIMRWYGMDVPQRKDCPLCGQNILEIDDSAEHLMASLKAIGADNFEDLTLF